ncbi:MAG: gamma-glutamyl-gamma-aminobutyrate hydrolase family protein [Halanaerobiales bacterium]
MSRSIIGIAPNHNNDAKEYRLKSFYTQAVESVGGLPVILPFTSEAENVRQYVKQIDGLLLTGGTDVDPLIYGENPLPAMGEIDPERDRFEIDLVKFAIQSEVSILGICKGCQMINIGFGGSLYQDIYSQKENVLKHTQEAPRWYPTHTITIKEGSLLKHIIQKDEIRVNSTHHQAIKKVGSNLIISALAEDGVIEAVEFNGDRFILGVQWHPETLWENSEVHFDIFRKFVEKCIER